MAQNSEGHPPGLYVLFTTEAAERFSFYTMRALLILYLTSVVFIDVFRGSDEYRRELEQEVKNQPQDVFAAAMSTIADRKREREALHNAFDDLGQDAGAYFNDAVATSSDGVDGIVNGAFNLLEGDIKEQFCDVIGNLADKAKYASWVVSTKIRRTIRDEALAVYALYLLLVYLSGLAGGYLADRLLGARKAIIIGGIVMGLGLFAMAMPGTTWLYYGLGLIVTGNAFFKPNISTIVSSLYPEGDRRRDPAFTIFYMGINLGALLAIFGAGLGERIAWWIGFALAGGGMVFSLAVFLIGQRTLGTAGFPPGRDVTNESRLESRDWRDIFIWAVALTIGVWVFLLLWNTALGPLWGMLSGPAKLFVFAVLVIGGLAGFVAINRDNSKEEWQRVGAIVVLSLFVIFFWAGFEQAGGTMNLFAYEQTDRVLFDGDQAANQAEAYCSPVANAAAAINTPSQDGGSDSGGWEVPATWFQGFNPLFIIVLAPLFSLLWGWNDRRQRGLSTPAKMGVGMVVLGLGFVIMYFGQQVANQYGQAGMGWLVSVYLLHTMGELCLSPIGLSMVTKLSPARRVSLMMGVWFACTAVADYLSGRLEAIVHHFELSLWGTLIATSVGAGLLLLMLTPMLKKWMHGRA